MRYILMARNRDDNNQTYFDEEEEKFIQTTIIEHKLRPSMALTGFGMAFYGIVQVNASFFTTLFDSFGSPIRQIIAILIGILIFYFRKKYWKNKVTTRSKVYQKSKESITVESISELYRLNFQVCLGLLFLVIICSVLLIFKIDINYIELVVAIYLLIPYPFSSIILAIYKDSLFRKKKALAIYRNYVEK